MNVKERFAKLCDGLSKCIDKLGEVEIEGVRIQDAIAEILNVDGADTLDDHVSMQPALYAFWGQKHNEAEEMFRRVEEDFEFWKQRIKNKRSDSISYDLGARPSKVDVNGWLMVHYPKGYKKRNDEVLAWKRRSSDLYVFVKAIHQKSFALTQYAGIVADEHRATDQIREKKIDEFHRKKKK